jgi:hypothetical protein
MPACSPCISRPSNDDPSRRTTIAKDQNTYAKRKREMDKKAKAEAKRARRNQRKLELRGGTNPPEETQDVDLNTPETDSINSENSR